MISRYVFVTIPQDPLIDANSGLFKDLLLQDKYNIIFNPVYKYYNSSIKNFIMRIIFANKLNFIFFAIKKYFYKFDKIWFNKNEKIYFIIPSMCAIKIDIKYLKKLKKENPNLNFILLILDSLGAHSLHLKYLNIEILNNNFWDCIMSFDRTDCEKHGFKYLGFFYYSSFNEIKPSMNKTDIYYIGFLKGKREELIGKIYDKCIVNNLSANINIIYKKILKINNSNLKTSTIRKSYPNIIAEIKSTNCILEVLQKGQESQSIRYFEAVVYNKKLLSNNPNLKKLPFYDERYMKYFEKVDDIDWKWVAKREDIDYKYNNEFSPIHMLEQIEKDFERK